MLKNKVITRIKVKYSAKSLLKPFKYLNFKGHKVLYPNIEKNCSKV